MWLLRRHLQILSMLRKHLTWSKSQISKKILNMLKWLEDLQKHNRQTIGWALHFISELFHRQYWTDQSVLDSGFFFFSRVNRKMFYLLPLYVGAWNCTVVKLRKLPSIEISSEIPPKAILRWQWVNSVRWNCLIDGWSGWPAGRLVREGQRATSGATQMERKIELGRRGRRRHQSLVNGLLSKRHSRDFVTHFINFYIYVD